MVNAEQDLLQGFLNSYDRRHTRRAYRYDLIDFFGQEAISVDDARGVTPERIDDYLQKQRAAGLSDGTVKRRWVSIRTFFAWAVDQRHIESDPASDVSL